MLTARCLHEAGLRVELLERGKLGMESSWAGGGILSPLYPWRYNRAVNRLAAAGQVEFPRFAAQLEEETGIDPEWMASGLLVLDDDEIEAGSAWCRQSGYAHRVQDRQELRQLETTLADEFYSALLLPDVAQVRNPRLVRALNASLRRHGISCREGVEVTAIEVSAGRASGVRTATGVLKAGKVVIAGGAWSAGLWPGKDTIAITPVQGQMIAFQAQAGLLHHILLLDEQYVIPRRDGHILAGSTLEHVGFDKQTSAVALANLRQAAIRMLLILDTHQVVQQWAGLRPGSPDNVPFIGGHPDIEDLFVNAGHFRYGVVMGLPSARLLADLVLGRTPSVAAEDYALPRIH